MALLWLSVPLKDGAARSVITVTTSCERYLSGCRVGAAVSVCRWPAVTSRRTPGSVLRPVGALALGWMMLMLTDELSDGAAAVIPSPVFQLWVDSLERSRSWFCP